MTQGNRHHWDEKRKVGQFSLPMNRIGQLFRFLKNDKIFCFLLIIATCIAYQPVWRAGFIWDDDQYVTGNALLHSLDGLRRIWFAPGATPQYYPLTFTLFWLEYHLWGLNPLGYHLMNVLLHVCNAILFFKVLRSLRVAGEWLAAGIFALHPVCVESVAFVTESKNTLSCLFYLGSLLAAFRFWRLDKLDHAPNGGSFSYVNSSGQFGEWKFYCLSLILYICALFSKTATAPLPVVIILFGWWKRRSISIRNICSILPFFVVGIVLGAITMHVEKDLGAVGENKSLTWLLRCLIAAHAVWFYLGKLVWPDPLLFIYERWKIDISQPLNYLPLLFLFCAFVILWLKRRSWGRSFLLAFGYYLMLLSLVIGFFDIYYFRFSFVSDHFQYLASFAPIAFASAGYAIASKKWRRLAVFQVFPSMILLLLLGFMTFRQSKMYRNNELLWRTTLTGNPEAFLAHNNLGQILLQKGEKSEAMNHFRRALSIQPDDAATENNLGAALIQDGRFEEALPHIQSAIKLEPAYAIAYVNLGNAFLSTKRTNEALAAFKAALQIQPNMADAFYNLGNAYFYIGELTNAMQSWQRTLEIQPDNVMAHNNLGNAFLRIGCLSRALKHFQKTVDVNADFVDGHNNLATALLQCGRPSDAVEHWNRALEVQPDYIPVQNNLAWVLATCPVDSVRNGPKAIKLAQEANSASGGKNPLILRTLAASYAEGHQTVKAVLVARQAMELARSDLELYQVIRKELIVYESGFPIRDLNQTNIPPELKPLRNKYAPMAE